MLNRVPDSFWTFLFGVLLTTYVFAATFKYLPSPLEMFGNVAAECRQAAIDGQKQSKGSNSAPKERPSSLEHSKSNNLENDPDAQKREYDCLIAKYTGSVADFTRWLVFATALLAGFGFWQVIISRQTARRQLRAYVDIQSGQVLGFDTGTVRVRMVTKNSGQTPAYEVDQWIAVGADDFPPKTGFHAQDPKPPPLKTTLAPGAVHTAFQEYGQLSAGQIAKIKDGKAAIWAWGEITYKDAFGRSRKSWFRFIYRGVVDTDPPGGMSAAAEGNGAN